MLITIRSKRWRMVSKRLPDAWGHCQPPNKPRKEICISPAIRTPAGMIEIVTHELLHAALWDLDESAVEETAIDIARVLVRLGVTLDVAAVHRQLKDGTNARSSD